MPFPFESITLTENERADCMEATPFAVAVVNRKGGCSKTATCHMLGGCFAKMGLRTLLIDMDPQANLTQGFFGPQWTEAREPRETIVALFDERLDPDPEKLIKKTAFENLSIVPGNMLDLENWNYPKPNETAPELQTALRAFMNEARPLYDVCLIDCPPTLMLMTWNGLLAADFVMVPLQPEDFGAQGITHIQRTVDLALEKYNPRLRMLGYLITQRGRFSIHDAYEGQLRKLYGDQVLTAGFPYKKDFKEAIAARTPIHFHKPRSAAAKDIQAIGIEVLKRVPELVRQTPEFLHFENRLLKAQELRKAV